MYEIATVEDDGLVTVTTDAPTGHTVLTVSDGVNEVTVHLTADNAGDSNPRGLARALLS